MRFFAVSGIFFLFSGLFFLFFVAAGVAGAQGAAVGDQYQNEEISQAEDELEDREEALQRKINEISKVGADLEESQALVNGARGRAGDLRGEARGLRRDLEEREIAHERARESYEESVRDAYKGGGLKGLDLILDGLLGPGDSAEIGEIGENPAVSRILFGGRDALQRYQDSEQTLQETIRQVSQKNRAYDQAVEEEDLRSEELRREEEALDRAAEGLRSERDASAGYLRELREEERARIEDSVPATGGSAGQRGYEIRLARERIVAEEVEPIPYERYVRLYKESAEKYGFGEDWHILAAVGKVESDHGRNLGPSTAGAMGPMQFLPSTWVTSGVDGNGDGVANVMDPEDAIPAAAKYLQTGGAPEDWYAALYSYNHADWYVKKVLAVAEGYRLIDGDESVGPYAVGG